jgi:YbgC/YbaW family acyl-CoA thioester hydrolase
MSFTHEWKFTVLEGHLDTFAHMNHATYLQIFEQARWDLITNRGFGLKVIQETQVGPVILEANIKYQKELKLREEITIRTTAEPYRGKFGVVKQQMFKPNGDIAADLAVTFGLFDMKERKLIGPTASWLHAIGLSG